jgi:(p)ppGpp synthase/HD superfamily hydrolase
VSSLKLYEAIHTILKAHDGQYRKLGGDPYAVHPIEVSLLVSRWGADESVVIAGLLHDVVEDTLWTIDEVSEIFGQTVAEMVEFCSELDKSNPWKIRKQAMIDKINQPGHENAKLIILADKLCNIKSVERSLCEMDESEVWKNFNAPKEEQRWYYVEMIRGLSDFENHTLCREDFLLLKRLVSKIFNVTF